MTLKMTSAIWGTVAFLAITGLLVAVMPAGKSFVDASSGLWNMLFPPLIFGTGLIAITALNTALQKRTAKVLTGFLKRVLEASDTDR